LIEGGAKRFNSLNGSIGPTLGDLALKFIGMDSKTLKIDLTSRSSWFTFEKSFDTFFEPTDMLLCAS
jgi:hypothetical protein